MKTAIYPGSFDPVTLGHINIIKRAALAFDKVIVCVMVNSEKHGGLFTPEERVELIRRVVAKLPNVEVEQSSGRGIRCQLRPGSRIREGERSPGPGEGPAGGV